MSEKMKSTQSPNSDDFDAAMGWASKLVLGAVPAHDRYRLDAWLAEDTSRQDLLSEALEAFDAPSTIFAAVLAADKVTLLERLGLTSFPIKSIFKSMTTRKPFYGLAGALVAFVIVYLGWGYQPEAEYDVVYLAAAQDRTLSLEDGSNITLARGSELQVRFSSEQRTASLVTGEAFFDVSRDPSRPFSVRSGDSRVSVVGTQFNISNWQKGTSVTVLEGVVRWQGQRSSAPIEMRAGDALSVTGGDSPSTSEIDLQSYVDWRSGWVTADRMPIGEIIAKLSRYSDAEILLSGGVNIGAPVTGRFELSQTQTTLHSIAALYGLEISSERGKIILSKGTDS